MKTLTSAKLEQATVYPGLLDSHIHLDSNAYQHDLEGCLQRAAQVGVTAMLLPSTDLESSRAIARLCHQHPGVLYGALGIHPHQAGQFEAATTPDQIRALLPTLAWSAIGETGLECHYDFCPMEQQIVSLEAHLDLAEESGLPLILHCRQAEAQLYERLKPRAGKLGGVVHCFTGGWSWAKRFLDLGFYLGVGGLVTLPKAAEVAEVAAAVPSDRWLLETDGPYLSPIPFRGYRNESCLLPWVVDRLAELRQTSGSELVACARANAQALFRF